MQTWIQFQDYLRRSWYAAYRIFLSRRIRYVVNVKRTKLPNPHSNPRTL
ncbi:uncharacterized protein M6B38_387530 [Iris pallida]|uniref:Uncharacterized protein n=1 Tax=Iris pallida TaxID=29817 RepID=A0AAX6G3U1_IRIPA|nr:uncharacterized protein M6B38_387530 [Iris pallida]